MLRLMGGKADIIGSLGGKNAAQATQAGEEAGRVLYKTGPQRNFIGSIRHISGDSWPTIRSAPPRPSGFDRSTSSGFR